jgi:vancomycin permeability regulator SanA
MLKLTGLVAILITFAVLPKKLLEWRAQSLIRTVADAPQKPVAIVFGAGLNRNGQPSSVLLDRVAVASELYQQGKVETLLMSGTRRGETYDESQAMADLAQEMGVPSSAILIDPHGIRTYETCREARDTFGVRDALLVTQRYHLPRALATCRGLGVTAEGVAADLREYHPRASRYWEMREIPATLVALWETYVDPPPERDQT